MKDIKPKRIGSLIRSFGYFAIMGLFGLLISSLGPVLPDLSNQVSVPLDVLSLIFTARAFGFLFGSLLGGKLFDNYKGHPLFAIFFLLLSLMTIMLPLCTSFWMLVGIVFFSGDITWLRGRGRINVHHMGTSPEHRPMVEHTKFY